MTTFIPGRELSRAYYEDVVAALLGGVRHSAALLGYGSDVLGYDSERSTDHGWGPRVLVFVDAQHVEPLKAAVERGLPSTFRERPTRFGWDDVPVQHHVHVATLDAWLSRQLGFDARRGVSTTDWLTTPQQLLLEVTGGAVFHDGLGELEPLRETLAWYPDDVWLWLLGCQWWRLDQEEPFVGRTAEARDDLGSRVVAARLVRDAVRLAFLLERQYAPYSKWLGSAFAKLDLAPAIRPALERVLPAADFPAREEAWVQVVETLARRHNELAPTAPLDPSVRLFHGRPFRVIAAGRFARACLDAVRDPGLLSLPRIGSVDQFVDSTDVLSDAGQSRRLASFYGSMPPNALRA